MLKVEDKVLIGSLKIPAVVKEIEEDQVLVALDTVIDGKSKNILQWYFKSCVNEIVDNHTEAVEIVEELKEKGLTDEEISELSGNSVMFQSKCVELGIIPKNENGVIDGK